MPQNTPQSGCLSRRRQPASLRGSVGRPRLVPLAMAIVMSVAMTGCTVITVTGAAIGVAAVAAGTAVDVAVGTVKVGAKAGSKAVDLVTGNKEK